MGIHTRKTIEKYLEEIPENAIKIPFFEAYWICRSQSQKICQKARFEVLAMIQEENQRQQRENIYSR